MYNCESSIYLSDIKNVIRKKVVSEMKTKY